MGTEVKKTTAPARKPAREPGDEPAEDTLAETPRLDTYEARRKVRLAVGSVAVGLVALMVFGLVRLLSPNAPDWSDLPDEALLMRPRSELARTAATVVGDDRERLDREARLKFHHARQVDRQGDTALAVTLLGAITRDYTGTPTAEQARQVLDRPSRGLPLFGDSPALGAESLAAAEDEPDEPVAMIIAETPRAPAEPRRITGLIQPTADVPALTLPEGFQARPEAGVHRSGWPLEIVGDRDGATLVLVPGGSFLMGRDDGPLPQRPAHRVILSPFYIDQHEVTVSQFRRFLRETAGHTELPRHPGHDPSEPDPPEDFPIVNVTFREAEAYARWAGKSLPTEAQWEMAARTSDGRLFPWGPSPPSWDRPRAWKQIDPVMSFDGDLSPFGVFDLAGNAWEWTADWYDPRYFQQFQGATAFDPTGPETSRSHPPRVTVKGGARDGTVSWREGMPAATRLPYLGFRCALPVASPADATVTPPSSAPAPSPPTPVRGRAPSMPPAIAAPAGVPEAPATPTRPPAVPPLVLPPPPSPEATPPPDRRGLVPF